MKILSLDLAVTTGWAYTNTDTSELQGGVWDLKPKRGSSQGMKLILLRSHIQGMIEATSGVDLIVYEKPAGRFMTGVISVAEMVSVVKLFCEDNSINYTSYRPTEVKKYATGKGNCNKDAMVQEAKRRWPHLNIIDDNMADALLMLSLTTKDLSL